MIGRILLAVLFIIAGSLHFLHPAIYLKIIPPSLPAHLAILYVSGAAEILGGLGLLFPQTRYVAAWGLVALLIVILPANIYMATAHLPAPGIMGQSWAQWLRIPLQLPLIFWAWLYTRTP
ncbi:DoxX family protein [Tunturibacter psychrotolerans]|uniref:DoxX family protein n=1 Tax=Tunturiibacter psychrotolerans TaxID=3069686 RepID=A0AAU7ZUV8_9BACT